MADTKANLTIGSGGRLNADLRDGDGLPWAHDSEAAEAPLPNFVKPKVIDPVAPSPASSARPGSQPPSRKREAVTTFLELGGIVAFSTGFFMISPALGLIVSGLAAVLLGVALSDIGK